MTVNRLTREERALLEFVLSLGQAGRTLTRASEAYYEHMIAASQEREAAQAARTVDDGPASAPALDVLDELRRVAGPYFKGYDPLKERAEDRAAEPAEPERRVYHPGPLELPVDWVTERGLNLSDDALPGRRPPSDEPPTSTERKLGEALSALERERKLRQAAEADTRAASKRLGAELERLGQAHAERDRLESGNKYLEAELRYARAQVEAWRKSAENAEARHKARLIAESGPG